MPLSYLFVSFFLFLFCLYCGESTGLLLGLNNGVKETADLPTKQCPFTCGLAGKDELTCENVKTKRFSSEIPCWIDYEHERFIIGERTSIRRIMVSGLKNLNRPLTKYFKNSGNLLKIFINLSILEVDQASFFGLEQVLGGIEILYVVSIHPDTFQNLRHLSFFVITSSRIPNPPADMTTSVSPDILPGFLLLDPQDPGSPIAFNIEVRCHRCSSEDSLSGPTVVTFPTNAASDSSGDSIDVLSLIYPDSCPKILDGLGCPKSSLSNEILLFPFIINASAPTGWKLDLANDDGLEPANKASNTSALTLFLIIWCTLLTLFSFFLCVALLVKRRQNKHHIRGCPQTTVFNGTGSAVTLKRMACQTTSLEHLNQQSFSAQPPENWACEAPSSLASSCRMLSQNGQLLGNSEISYRSDYRRSEPNGFILNNGVVLPRCSEDYKRDKLSFNENHTHLAPNMLPQLNGHSIYQSDASDLPYLEKPTLSRNGFPESPSLASYKRSQDGLFQMC